jgi:hypothetical protein
MVARAAEMLQEKPRWLRKVVRAIRTQFSEPPRHDVEVLARALLAHPSFRVGRMRRLVAAEPEMGPAPFPVPAIATVAELSRFFDVPLGVLDWVADRKGLQRDARDEPLLPYRYTWQEKRTGGLRLIEAPKPRLRALQRRVLREILDAVPPHECAHGFRRGRSVVTAATAHVDRDVVVRMDLADFFGSIQASRVVALFHRLGYPEEVARTLAGICTSRVPHHVMNEGRHRMHADPAAPTGPRIDEFHRLARHLAWPHLPQGAPTSPALANLAAFRLDVRLSSLASTMHARYTRYADDLVFSGDRRLASDRFHALVATIALSEGFDLATRKTRVMRRSTRQRVTSIVVNEHPNVDRATYDALKATLHNCARLGPSTQNRAGVADLEAHLRGRVAWVAQVSPARGAKLQAMFDAIDWSR